MAPTIDLSDRPEPPFQLDLHLARLAPPPSHCTGERRKSLQNRKKSNRHLLHKLQMGLVVKECLQSPTSCSNSPSFHSDVCNSSERHSLVHITLRTLALLRRNHQLQLKLSLLQAETRAFVESVVSSSQEAHPEK